MTVRGNKFKILQLITALDYGGAEKFCVELSNELSHQYDVTLCTIRPDQNWINKKNISDRIKYENIGISSKYNIRLIFKLITLMKQFKPDIIHIHSSFIAFYFILIRFLLNKSIVIQTVHSTLTSGYKNQLDILKYFLPGIINITISDDIQKQLSKLYTSMTFYNIDNGIANLNLTNLNAPVFREIEGYKKNNNPKIFTAIGNYSYQKNFIMLAELFVDLTQEDVILLIIGNDKDPEKRNYKKVLTVKGTNTYLLGNKENVADYLYCSDCLISSSLQEGMPLTIIEAFSMGIPVVATPAGGVVDMVIDGENGFLANGFKKDDLKEAVYRFMNASVEDIERIKDNNVKRFREKYSIETCAKKYELLYKEILASNKTNKTNRM